MAQMHRAYLNHQPTLHHESCRTVQTMNNETHLTTISKYCIRNAPGADGSLCHIIQTFLF